MNERIRRITEMEKRLIRLLAWNAGDTAVAKETVQKDVCLLDEYCKGHLRREDFKADETGGTAGGSAPRRAV